MTTCYFWKILANCEKNCFISKRYLQSWNTLGLFSVHKMITDHNRSRVSWSGASGGSSADCKLRLIIFELIYCRHQKTLTSWPEGRPHACRYSGSELVVSAVGSQSFGHWHCRLVRHVGFNPEWPVIKPQLPISTSIKHSSILDNLNQHFYFLYFWLNGIAALYGKKSQSYGTSPAIWDHALGLNRWNGVSFLTVTSIVESSNKCLHFWPLLIVALTSAWRSG